MIYSLQMLSIVTKTSMIDVRVFELQSSQTVLLLPNKGKASRNEHKHSQNHSKNKNPR